MYKIITAESSHLFSKASTITQESNFDGYFGKDATSQKDKYFEKEKQIRQA